MFKNIVDAICQIAHYQSPHQISSNQLKTLILINAIQYASQLFPMDGWNQWKLEITIFDYIKQLLYIPVITPLLQQYDNEVITEITIILGVISSTIVLIFIVGIAMVSQWELDTLSKGFDKSNTDIYRGWQNLVLRYVYYYFLVINGVLAIPLSTLYFNAIFCRSHQSISICITNHMFILALLGQILLSLLQVITIYFFRALKFIPSSNLQLKFSPIQFIALLTRTIAISLGQLESNGVNSYARLTCLHMIFIVNFLDSSNNFPYTPDVNRFNFITQFVLECLCLAVSINVVSGDSLISYQFLLFVILIIITFAIAFGDQFYDMVRYKYDIQSGTQGGMLSFAQDIYENSQQLKEFNTQSVFIKYYRLLRVHKKLCHTNCKQTHLNVKKSVKSIILCILTSYIKLVKSDSKADYEIIQLAYISFLSGICKKPLLAYVELKKYELMNHQQSSYFQQMKIQINMALEDQIRLQQSNNRLFNSNQNKSLEIQLISRALKNEQIYIPKFMAILDLKMALWESEIKGFQSIYDLQRMVINISKNVQQLHLELNQTLSINLNEIEHLTTNSNVLELKLASVFFSAIMNDYYSTSQCEFLISEIFNMEHTLSTETITNLTFVEDKAVMIMISMVKNRGQIVNRDRRNLAQYFGYEDTEFQQITNISQLMPNYMQGVHDQLLTDYLQRAKSFLFNQYTLVFSADKLGFLVAQQLKIDNNFMIREDYILMGVLSKIKQSSEFILFNEDGRITACSQGFFTQFVLDVDDKMTLSKFLNAAFIFMFFPNFLKVLNSYKSQFVDSENWIVEEQSQLLSRRNISDVIQQFNVNNARSLNKFHRSENNTSNQQSFYQSEKTIPSDQIIDENDNINDDKLQMSDKLKLFQTNYQEYISDYLQQLDESQTIRFYAKYSLRFKQLGQSKGKCKSGQMFKQFFVLELLDIRKKDVIGRTIASSAKTILETDRLASIENNQNMTVFSLSGFSQMEVPYQEVIPDRGIESGVSDLLQRFGSKKQKLFDQTFEPQGIMGQDTGRDSLSYGPISQRAQFINPSIKVIHVDETPRLDLDFNELIVQQQISGSMIRKQDDYEGDDYDQEESVKKQGNISSTEKKEDKSGKILKILQFNQLKVNHREDEEIEAIKSRSSVTSKTSGTAIQIIKRFQGLTHLISSLKMVMYININLFIIFIILLVVHIMIITQSHTDTINTIGDINGPFVFNRNYLEIISFSWSLVFGALGIINPSVMLRTQTVSDLRNTSLSVFDDLQNMYSTFLDVEERGLLSNQTFIFLNGDIETAQFTYFMNLVQNELAEVVTILDGDEEEIFERISNIPYMDSLLTLRVNLNNVFTMASELIDSLNIIFLNQSESRVNEMQIQVIVEIMCFGIVLLMQIYFWRNIENYCQQIMLLTGRLQESDATEMIARATFVKETLTQQSGKFSWKKANYYQLNYAPIYTLGIEAFNAQSRYLRDFANKHRKHEQIQQSQSSQSGQKRNTNVVLNSRIYRTQVSIMTALLIVIVTLIIFAMLFIGGFLLFKQQSDDLLPSQTLTSNYIKFTSQLDTLISCAFIVKTQPLLYQTLVDLNIYDMDTLQTYYDSIELFGLLKQLSNSYSSNLSNIYEDIIQSKKIDRSDKQLLYALYQDDFCEEIGDEIPMCNYEDMGYDLFVSTFNEPDVDLDNNLDYVSQGIVGVVSRLDTLFKQTYDYELTHLTYQPNLTIVNNQINQREFRNAIFWHFLDTNDGTNTFLEIIQISILKILEQNLSNLYLYYSTLGTVLIVVYAIFYTYWIRQTNIRLIRVRLALTNLPIDVLMEQHTLSLLKRLN